MPGRKRSYDGSRARPRSTVIAAEAEPDEIGLGLDVESQRWVQGLAPENPHREVALRRLHGLLLRVARREANRRRGWLGAVRGPELDDLANQAADDALMTLTAKIGEFRGESRFTTWAYKFVVFGVSHKMARHAWRTHAPRADEDALRSVPDRLTPLPHDSLEERERLRTLRAAVDDVLTARQRAVFVAAALNDVPIDVLALQLGSSRNAIYKTLFDARRKLRACLAAGGHPLTEK